MYNTYNIFLLNVFNNIMYRIIKGKKKQLCIKSKLNKKTKKKKKKKLVKYEMSIIVYIVKRHLYKVTLRKWKIT